MPFTSAAVAVRQRSARGAATVTAGGIEYVLVGCTPLITLLIFAGSATGAIFVFKADKESIQHVNTLQAPCGQICDVIADPANPGMWGCSDETGSIVMWQGFSQVVSFPPTGYLNCIFV